MPTPVRIITPINSASTPAAPTTTNNIAPIPRSTAAAVVQRFAAVSELRQISRFSSVKTILRIRISLLMRTFLKRRLPRRVRRQAKVERQGSQVHLQMHPRPLHQVQSWPHLQHLQNQVVLHPLNQVQKKKTRKEVQHTLATGTM